MRALIVDVAGDASEIGASDGETAIAGLPPEPGPASLVDVVRTCAFELLFDACNRYGRRKPDQVVDVVLYTMAIPTT